MPRTAGPAAPRLHGNAAGQVAVSTRDNVDWIARRYDVMTTSRFHGTAALTWLCNHCNE